MIRIKARVDTSGSSKGLVELGSNNDDICCSCFSTSRTSSEDDVGAALEFD